MDEIKLKSEYPDLDKYKYSDGEIIYYKKNTHKIHNPYGPAIVSDNGYKAYYIENKWHRLDGPARTWINGDKEYYINGNLIGNSKQEFYNNIKNLEVNNLNKKYKLNILDIKHYISNGLDANSINILKSLL